MFERVLQSAVGLFLWGLFLFAGAATIVFAIFDFLSVARMAAVLDAPGLVAPGGFPATARTYGALGTSILVGIVIKAVVKLVVGFGLLGAGAWGLRARLCTGLSGTAAAQEPSPIRRWATICTFTFGIGVAAYGLMGLVRAFPAAGPHVLAGIRIQGTVEDRRVVRDPETGEVRFHLLSVLYSPKQRRLWSATLKVPYSRGQTLSHGDEVALVHPIYDPQDVVLAEEMPGALGVLWPFIWRGLFIFVGVRGIHRNWPSRDQGTSMPQNPAPHDLSAADRGRRTTFGRRGAS
ncbi:hypothetical protein [Stappia sp. ES.058]|uniref:hypothetical protein n=1 Tax=Stappia sp. ES.058 TaxID=1881061 RepID=UPI00087BE5A3|nr:hypothetical protein [Stappia sp. ES.058]SDU20298.1 hypothetical protein SAMN05428979_2254 [Stappia sp. ES.058]